MSSHEAATTHDHNEEPRSKTSMSASFWFAIILVGLFIAALNFISVMGHDSAEGHGGHATHEAALPTEGHHEGTNNEATHEATENISNHPAATSNDSAHAESAHH